MGYFITILHEISKSIFLKNVRLPNSSSNFFLSMNILVFVLSNTFEFKKVNINSNMMSLVIQMSYEGTEHALKWPAGCVFCLKFSLNHYTWLNHIRTVCWLKLFMQSYPSSCYKVCWRQDRIKKNGLCLSAHNPSVRPTI